MYLIQSVKGFIGAANYVYKELPYIIRRNSINARYLDIPARKNRVNIFQYHPERHFGFKGNPYNLGDSLGEVIVQFLLEQKGIDMDAPVSKTKHLNCVGSNIFGSYQDATIWGSGAFPRYPTKKQYFCQKLSGRKLDIRAVRGPLTREVLQKLGYNCPETYGDPAILMPMIYNPNIEKKYHSLVIPQYFYEKKFRAAHPNERMVSMNTNDYKHVIDEIVASEIVITSSLHGIILAEAYGVPAVFFRGLRKSIDFKYHDWYCSTGRDDITLSDTYEEALETTPPPLPDLSGLVKGLLDTFPYDLWEPDNKTALQ